MSGRILNFDKVITQTVTVAVNGGPTWELRDDVPAGTLALAFRVFDLERQLVRQPGEEPLGVQEEAQLLDALDEAKLEVVTAIVRHSYPDVTQAEVGQALSPSARGQVLQVFFPLLLARFGRPSLNSPSAASATPSSTETTTTPTTTTTGPNRAARRAAAGTDTTRSRRR